MFINIHWGVLGVKLAVVCSGGSLPAPSAATVAVTVVRVMPLLAALIATVVGVERAPGGRAVVTGAARHTGRQLYTDTGSADHSVTEAGIRQNGA